MKTKVDIAYYPDRVCTSRAAAAVAKDVCARDSHNGLAKAYQLVVQALRAKQQMVAARPRG